MNFIESFKLWLIVAIITVIGSILIFLAKWFFNETLKLLNDIKQELKDLGHITTIQQVKIENLNKGNADLTDRVNRHSNRLMDLEKQLISVIGTINANRDIQNSKS